MVADSGNRDEFFGAIGFGEFVSVETLIRKNRYSLNIDDVTFGAPTDLQIWDFFFGPIFSSATPLSIHPAVCSSRGLRMLHTEQPLEVISRSVADPRRRRFMGQLANN